MKLHYSIPLIFGLLFLGCENGINCIIPKEPELPNKSFPIASTESFYYTDLRVGITNEPRDEDYDYYFDVSGLPVGMDYFVNYRTISIEGTPEFTGTYRITIYLDVDGPFREYEDDSDVLCNYSTSKTYILIVE
ncbi:hypothetical protein [Winogradskyella schleiferi]|uniref:hypothetical protein n=1 Tax=Winogradskyella schleiferi TaxID=2686078 RepID=UPI0015BBC8C4|nr:hypothetical protein [Winogradskyella schleiferi]